VKTALTGLAAEQRDGSHRGQIDSLLLRLKNDGSDCCPRACDCETRADLAGLRIRQGGITSAQKLGYGPGSNSKNGADCQSLSGDKTP
jgi:hypothetical protein